MIGPPILIEMLRRREQLQQYGSRVAEVYPLRCSRTGVSPSGFAMRRVSWVVDKIVDAGHMGDVGAAVVRHKALPSLPFGRPCAGP